MVFFSVEHCFQVVGSFCSVLLPARGGSSGVYIGRSVPGGGKMEVFVTVDSSWLLTVHCSSKGPQKFTRVRTAATALGQYGGLNTVLGFIILYLQ